VLPALSAANTRLRHALRPVIEPVSDRVGHRGLDPADVLLASYPRSGNTWMRFLLYELLTGKPTDYAAVRRTIPYVGYHRGAVALLEDGGRVIKTHELWRNAYRGKRAIYIVRDARDVAISEHKFRTRNGAYNKDFDTFVDEFLQGRVQRFGSWAAHVSSWLDGDPGFGRLHVVRFEELRADTPEVMSRVLEFLGVRRSRAEIEAAVEANSVESMRLKEDASTMKKRIAKSPPAGSRFVNKGAVGGWRAVLTEEQSRRIAAAAGSVLERAGYEVV
jgi:estrone sulfotransferase